MIVILDTGILVRDFVMQGTTFKTFLGGLERVGYTWYVPRVVLDETINKYGEMFEKTLNGTRRLGVKSLEFVTGTTITSSDEAKNEYQAYLLRNLQRVNAQVVDYPEVAHAELMERALARKKPFRKSDTGGYRDTLIWMTILQKLSEHARISFITSNTTDFSDPSNKINLHPHLVEDINELGQDTGEISFFITLDSFVEQHIRPTLELLDNTRTQIENDTYEEFNLHDLLVSHLMETIEHIDLEPTDIGFPLEYESPTISAIEDVLNIRNVDARRLSDNEILVSFSAEIEGVFTFFIYKSDYYSLSYDNLEIWDNDWNKWYMLASATAQIELSMNFTYNPELHKVTSSEIIQVVPLEEFAG